jgi:hypothetical protein
MSRFAVVGNHRLAGSSLIDSKSVGLVPARRDSTHPTNFRLTGGEARIVL